MLSKNEGFLKLNNIHKEYKLIGMVGAGTYGMVYKAWNYKHKKYFALKKIDISKNDSEGFPITAIREIKILKMLNHKNIIDLKELIMSKPNNHNNKRCSTFLVFEYMEHDFFCFLKKEVEFKLTEVKCIMKQILEGLLFLHQSKVREISAYFCIIFILSLAVRFIEIFYLCLYFFLFVDKKFLLNSQKKKSKANFKTFFIRLFIAILNPEISY
jgi:serine/threonine protein kinase